MRVWIMTGLAAGVLAMAAGPGLAQTGGDLLRGPEVDASEKRTGVGESRYAEGMMLDRVRPEVAALEILGLEAGERAEADRVLAERAAIVDRVVLAHVDELSRIEVAASNNDLFALWAIYSKLHAALEPLWARGALADELLAALPPDARGEYERHLREYEEALVAREAAAAEARGEKLNPVALQMQRHFRALQVEVEASVERTLVSGEREFERMLDKAQLSAEGEALVRARVLELIERVGLQPTDAQFVVALQGILAELEVDDRRRLVRAIRDQYVRNR